MSEVERPIVNLGNEPEIRRDANGVQYERKELNGHWVRYTFFDKSGQEINRIAMPRIEVFSQDDIARLDQKFNADNVDV